MQDYNAVIELNIKATRERTEAAVEGLAGFSPAAGTTQRGRLELTITVPATALHLATMTALALVEQATGATAAAVQAMTTQEFDARPAGAELPQLVSVTEAADILGVSRQAVLQMIDRGKLPAQQAGNTWVMAQAVVEELL